MEEEDWDGHGSINGKVLRIATTQNLPLSGVRQQEDGSVLGVGVAFEVVRLLERALNFSHRVVAISRDPLQPLVLGEADLVASFLPVPQQLKPDGVVYSTALATEQWVILMRRPEESASGTGLFAPFDTLVWLATLGALVAMGPVMYLLLLLRCHVTPHSSRPEFRLSSCVWFVYSAIMKQGSTLAPASDTCRMLFATWWVFITILTSFYTANLTAFLTLSRFTLPIEEARDLAYDALRWVGVAGGALEHAITKAEELSYLRGSLKAGFGRLLDLQDSEILELVMKGHVFLGERSAVERLVFHHYLQAARDGLDHAGRCTLVFTNKPFMVRPLAFAFPVNSTLVSVFNPVLRTLVEGGVLRHALRLDIPSREICPLNLGNSERQLRNADLLATYLAMVTGFFLATLAFLGEFLARRRRKRRFKHPEKPPHDLLTSNKHLLFYPRDFTLPPVNKSALLMDPHLFIVHRALNVRVVKPFRPPNRLPFTE